ncbi:alpha/beta hydrolase [Actinoplanes sp. CA-054009]
MPLSKVVTALAVLSALIAVPQAAQAAQAAPKLSWAACAEEELAGYQCSTTQVPLDHDRPRGATTTIALARRPAGDPAHRIGTIFVNPGGPGGAGRGMVTVADQLVSADVLARFDIVGFDPRGIGASDPLQCFATDAEAEALLAQMRLVPLSKPEIASTLRANYEYTEACKRDAGPLIAHMSTLNVARDLDLLRQAVGDAKLSYIGYSYGTHLGATYVNLFPGKVRAVVLDGNVDPDQRTNRRLANKFDRAGGFELALDGFLRACDAAGPACALSGDARAKYEKVRLRFRQGPVTLPGYGEVTLDDFTGYISSSMYDIASFPETAEVLRLAYDTITGTPSTLRATPGKITAPPARGGLPDAYSYTGNDAFYAVNCADAPLPRDPALYPGFAKVFEAAHPTFGRAEAFGEVGCANWPRTTERYNGPWDRKTSATVLLVNPTYDPATRYAFAQRMERELGNARLLTMTGFGHTSSFSACVTNWYTKYLIGGALPPKGTVCKQDRPPFPNS